LPFLEPAVTNDPEAGSRERALVEAALREAAESPTPPSAGSNPSVRARLGGGPFTLPPPGTFEGYELLRELHRGGQGVVYQAIQKTTRRKVAIKVMREGPFASQRERARFEREAQILGQLNHSGIVAIHDSGITHQGLSYFVMDYISGTPLDVYMAGVGGVKGAVDDALKLLVKVCEAVSAAHLKGIIHRDLKPGNIIVDGEGNPHILDFGLAKIAGGDTTGGGADQSLQLMTITGQFLGSMPWASPEQAEGRSEKIDVRTDVYSLGVILYQMLTGQFPYEVVGNMREVLENILTIQPAPPRKFRKQINEDVERIIFKCLSKERERRYQSAAELVRDIHHYLNREPIEARRDSLTYVVRMHLKRHKLAVAMIVPFVIAAAVGSVTSFVLWRKAEHERAETTALNLFLEKTLRSASPGIARGKDKTVVQMVEEAADALQHGELDDQPAVKAAAESWLGGTLVAMGGPGDAQKAEDHLRAALRTREKFYGENDLSVAETRAILGRALIDQDRLKEAGDCLERALAVQEQRLGPNDKALAQTLNSVAVLHQHEDDYARAQQLFERLVKIHRANGDRAALGPVLFNIAVLMDDQDHWKEAEPYFKEALEIHVDLKPENDPATAFIRAGYGWNLIKQARAPEAVPMLDKCLSARQRLYQEGNWYLPWTESLLGESLAHCPECNRADEAQARLVHGYEQLRANPQAPREPKDLARQWVVDFFDSRGQKDKADQYRAQ
jgi:serine/threonine protein kinase